MPKRNVSNKVYCVHSAITGNKNENELLNWSKYTLVAPDAELAISFAKSKFKEKGEYAESVELIAVLDDQENNLMATKNKSNHIEPITKGE